MGESRRSAGLSNSRAGLLSILLLGIAVGLGYFIWSFLPHERDVSSVWILLFKITPFIFATVGIAFIPRRLFKGLGALLFIPLSFLVILCFFIPKIFFNGDEFEKLYYTVLMATPYIILSLVTA